jgi:hypothetical protein
MSSSMKKELNSRRGILLFSVGATIGLLLALFMVWADLEARLFDPSMPGERVMSIRCPAVIGRDETVRVSASFHNPLDRDARYVIRTHISEGHVTLMRRLDAQLPLAPGERQRLEWEVTSEDAAYGLFALVKVHLFGFYPLPPRQGSCGVVFVNLPLPGGVIFGATLALALLGMGGGAALWLRANHPLGESASDTARAMAALSVLVILGLLMGLLNIWLAGLVVLAVSVLLASVLIGYRVEKRKK